MYILKNKYQQCKYRFGLLLLYFLPMSVCFAGHSPKSEYNILNYGATLDTMVVQTRGVQAAIDSCSNDGGGRVIVPAGKYKTGTLILKSNVELHLAPGAYLYASENYADLPMLPRSAYRSLKDASGWSALIFADGATNIAVTGKGTIDGRGHGRKGRPGTAGGDRDGRPRNLLFISCSNVQVSGITLMNAAMWNQHYLNCEDVWVSNIKAYNHANGNNDGIDIDGCRRFILSNSIIDSDDDGIVLKSTGAAACEDVVISNCIVSSFANAIKCGTESTGGFRNILISDCIVKPSSHKGQRVLKSTPDGITAISLMIVDGGVMDGVTVNNILIRGTQCPLYVRLGGRARKYIDEAPAPGKGIMRNISISNITAYSTGNYGSSITGVPGNSIENIVLQNLIFSNTGGLQQGVYADSAHKEGRSHDLMSDATSAAYLPDFNHVKEDSKGYPQPTVWQNLPSYGLFVRHVKSINTSNIILRSEGAEPRTPIIAVDVENFQLNNLKTSANTPTDVILHDVKRSAVDSNIKVNTTGSRPRQK